ncbi:chromosome condensation regulator [Leptospira santarosai]|uniref:RCC1 domain-containing protein n=1 Tax=Leptospira santarosai TaxID=28183 RepID=UPI0024AF5E45|nr:chromosome condensation regulator [Leptospira santarosai]MDI7184828.1 chromosome condensation regulator [Leptospira santarosai]MDI7200524.1 chromosome condensation regulator [Leptospira santarosai]
MKRNFTLILSIVCALNCSPQSRVDLTPLFLAAINLSQTSESQNEFPFRVISPQEGEILTVYRSETTVQANSEGEFEIFHEGKKLFTFPSSPSSPQTSPAFKPKNGENSIQIHFKKPDGTTFQKGINFYFGTKLSAGAAHSGFLKNGNVYTVGRNNFGQLGTGHSTGDNNNDVIVPLDSIRDIFSIHFNQNNSMAIAKNGRVYTWGNNAKGQLGIGNNNNPNPKEAGDRLPPTLVPGIDDAVMGAYGFNHALILKSDGTLVSFGQNNVGQLGNGEVNLNVNSFSTNPVAVVNLRDVIQVIAGSEHSAALTENGEVYVWGKNQYGNLGNGRLSAANTVQSTPVKVEGLSGIKQIANGRDHILALASDGKIYSWGLNASGQLGIGGSGFPNPTPIPTQVLNITNASSVWAGGTQSFSILKSGEVKGWGANGNTANLAIGETNTSKVYEPNKAVVGIENVIHFGCGATHNFALLRNGEIYGWGWNFKGSLGRQDLQSNWGTPNPVSITLP